MYCRSTNPFDWEVATVQLTGSTLKGRHVDIIADAGRDELFRDKESVFDPSAGVDVVANTIRFDTPHTFKNGDRMVYTLKEGVAVGGLANKGAYYAIVADPMTIQLSADYWQTGEFWTTPLAIDLTPSAAAGEHTLVAKSDFLSLSPGSIVDALLDDTLDTIGNLDFLNVLGFFDIELQFYDISPATISIAESSIKLDKGVTSPTTTIDAYDLNIQSTALTGADVITRIMPIWAAFGMTVPNASVYLNDGVVINTAQDLSINSQAESTNSVDVSTGFGLLGFDEALVNVHPGPVRSREVFPEPAADPGGGGLGHCQCAYHHCPGRRADRRR